tara:strand:- start:972 stop:1109 length:138 start_codon:yes stop_codon:yes gene_type:complete
MENLLIIWSEEKFLFPSIGAKIDMLVYPEKLPLLEEQDLPKAFLK